jgi:hypothetical protein
MPSRSSAPAEDRRRIRAGRIRRRDVTIRRSRVPDVYQGDVRGQFRQVSDLPQQNPAYRPTRHHMRPTCGYSLRAPHEGARRAHGATPSPPRRGFDRPSRARGASTCSAALSSRRAPVSPGRPSHSRRCGSGATRSGGASRGRWSPAEHRRRPSSRFARHQRTVFDWMGALSVFVKISPSGPVAKVLICAASASRVRSGNGIVRRLAGVFGGPNVGPPPGISTSCRSIVYVRRRKSTRSVVTPNASPWRTPVPAPGMTRAR